MNKALLFFLIFITAGTAVNAQDEEQDTTGVRIFGDFMLNKRIESRIEAREEEETMDGFRIQVYFGDDRKEANDVKEDLEEIFPDFNSYTIIELPYYKVRIGNFINRVQAQALFFALQHIFPHVFIVPDKIELPAIQQPQPPVPNDYKDYKKD